ncbi:MAG: SH3 domain-containing protein [Olpidium bornovanus]|uniref:SH3 domain-containing protein n=1 Tax=Olpidium bornovanus TaxID=278681 RepID=A0A8H7ZS01_9FUNG|nr:MAG: SH3 domain-containing protein [Olpidium bornovanus]
MNSIFANSAAANYVELINSDVSPDKQGPVDLPSAAASATAPERNQEHAEHLAPPAAGPALTATAAYDYTADEDNELTFREGDLIVNVRMTTEDWWEGETRDGRSGLFPGGCENGAIETDPCSARVVVCQLPRAANYVELNK